MKMGDNIVTQTRASNFLIFIMDHNIVKCIKLIRLVDQAPLKKHWDHRVH